MNSNISDQTKEVLASLVRHPEAIEQLAVDVRQRLVENPALELSRLSSQSKIIFAIVAGQTELWLHDNQKTKWVRGGMILDYLTHNKTLSSCANLAELEVIKAQGIEFFRRYFPGKAVSGWRGVRDNMVPRLIEKGNNVVLCWANLFFEQWYPTNGCLRYKDLNPV